MTRRESLAFVYNVTKDTKTNWHGKLWDVHNFYRAEQRHELDGVRWLVHIEASNNSLGRFDTEELLNTIGLTSVSSVVGVYSWLAVQTDRDAMLLRLFGWTLYDWHAIRAELRAAAP